MDTRFWGPSGWRLLHSITFAYDPNERSAVQTFFETLPFVLPCKFCRTSLQEYVEEDPVKPALESRDSLSRWLWRIHNKVNDKLRSQSLPVDPDPPFEKVKEFYEGLGGCYKTEFPGWDFLFSIADLHPMSLTARKSVPIHGATLCESMKTDEEKNKGNCLTPEERLPHYKEFWQSLGAVLPFKEWRDAWKSTLTHPRLSSRSKTVSWLWKKRCSMEHQLDLINRCKYSLLCKTLKHHRSGCNKSKRAKTCRKSRLKKSGL